MNLRYQNYASADLLCQSMQVSLRHVDRVTCRRQRFRELGQRIAAINLFPFAAIEEKLLHEPIPIIIDKMSDNDRSPLLGEESAASRPERPASQRSKASKHSRHTDASAESTPLLSRDVEHRDYGDAPMNGGAPSPATSSLRSLQNGVSSGKGTKLRRWTIVLAVTILCLIVIAILAFGFAAPAIVEQYAKQAPVFEPTNLSIDSFTSSGVTARVQGSFKLDASRVRKKSVRDLGKAATWIASRVESRQSKVEVFLPEYGNILIGTADVPRLVVDVRDGHTTHLDFLVDLTAGDVEGIQRIGRDWLAGRLDRLRVQGIAEVPLKSGIFGLGTQRLSEDMVFEGEFMYPAREIWRLN